MTETVRVYDCGCCDGAGQFVPCRRASRLDDRLHNALLDIEGFYCAAADLIRYPCTWDTPQYFERSRSIGEDADKLFEVAVELRELQRRVTVEERKESRAHRAICAHLRAQEAKGAYREKVVEPVRGDGCKEDDPL